MLIQDHQFIYGVQLWLLLLVVFKLLDRQEMTRGTGWAYQTISIFKTKKTNMVIGYMHANSICYGKSHILNSPLTQRKILDSCHAKWRYTICPGRHYKPDGYSCVQTHSHVHVCNIKIAFTWYIFNHPVAMVKWGCIRITGFFDVPS